MNLFAARQRYESTLPVHDCETVTYLIEADAQNAIDEYDELNNVTEVRLTPPALREVCTPFEHG